MITREDIDAFADMNADFEEHYATSHDAFEDMKDTLVEDERFTSLFGAEHDDFFQYAFTNWKDHLCSTGVDWLNLFDAWVIG